MNGLASAGFGIEGTTGFGAIKGLADNGLKAGLASAGFGAMKGLG